MYTYMSEVIIRLRIPSYIRKIYTVFVQTSMTHSHLHGEYYFNPQNEKNKQNALKLFVYIERSEFVETL